MSLKKFGELLQEFDFDAIHHELTMELKTDVHMVNMCKILYEGLKSIDYVPTKLKYALITSEDPDTGSATDKIIAYAEFLDRPISIHDLEPAEIVSTEVELDDPELEALFVALCLSTLCQEDDEEEDEDMPEEEITFKYEETFELGEKEYDEDSLFPFKKDVESNERVG